MSDDRFSRRVREAGYLAFKKGDRVIVRTTNGGEIISTLWCDYYRTYDCIIEDGDVVISAGRIKSVDAAPIPVMVDISTETAYGSTFQLSRPVRCF